MPRLARVDLANEVYHVINRANGRLTIFRTKEDYQLFEKLISEAKELTGMSIIAYTIMPNHWHFVLSPKNDGDMGIFMHRLSNSHTRNYHVQTKTIGTGHLYQGRYKSFLVDNDSYLLSLIKYVERNPVRAKLSERCEDWRWGSSWRRVSGTQEEQKLLDDSPTPIPDAYSQWVNTPEKEEEISLIRTSINKGVPYGRDAWVDTMIANHHLESTKRCSGRPRKM
ncbi:MAG: transposase [Candidatus Parcubacteria bacterium]|nr:transposase [Candidatus Parcubacteria bacterium]